MSLDQVRAVADAVLYEGYLLYPYRASSSKNQARWQFGVLGPPGAAAAGLGEAAGMSMQCLVAPPPDGAATVTLHLRFLQLQVREVQEATGNGGYRRVDELVVGNGTVLSWDEAVEREVVLPAQPLGVALDTRVEVPGGDDVESVLKDDGAPTGRIVRRRWPLSARVQLSTEPDDGFVRLSVSVENDNPEPVTDKESAIRQSLIGAHLLVQLRGAEFISLREPPDEGAAAAERCRQDRCWPVLAGPPGSSDVVLGAPIILEDHPALAEQSRGALFDSTEIDEILTLRVMTMTEAEKAEARATDPRAAAIIDRCDEMSADDLRALHGILHDPGHAADATIFDTGDVPWWDPEADASVRPEVDTVTIDGVLVAKGSLVRVHPSRRADAQDLFFADQVARVTAVLCDVDGAVHVAVVLVDDPAADLHEWYGRYLYFSPDELEPLPAERRPDEPTQPAQREESRS